MHQPQHALQAVCVSPPQARKSDVSILPSHSGLVYFLLKPQKKKSLIISNLSTYT
jgi:hypothetical protein